MGRSLALDAAGWAAVIASGDEAEQLGSAGSPDVIPANQRRRLPVFTRTVLRCAVPLMKDHPGAPLVYAAEHGDLDSTVALLTDIARGELLSPALFALSVHNAPAGALSLATPGAGDHTAIAGTDATPAAALTEAYARLVHGDAKVALIVIAEARYPEIYHCFDSEAPDAFLAMAVRLAEGDAAQAFDIGGGRAGVAAIAHALNQGAQRLRFSPPAFSAERAA